MKESLHSTQWSWGSGGEGYGGRDWKGPRTQVGRNYKGPGTFTWGGVEKARNSQIERARKHRTGKLGPFILLLDQAPPIVDQKEKKPL